jgi:hypothetical protein
VRARPGMRHGKVPEKRGPVSTPRELKGVDAGFCMTSAPRLCFAVMKANRGQAKALRGVQKSSKSEREFSVI